MKLIDDIKRSTELKEYWSSLLGEERLELIIQHPEIIEEAVNEEMKTESKQLQTAIQRLSNQENCDETILLGQNIAFVPFFQYIAEYVKGELKKRVTGFLRKTVICHIVLQITESLSWQCMRCLIEEMHCLKDAGMLVGNNPVEEYDDFCARYLRDISYIRKFLKKYHVLTKLIASKAVLASGYIQEILEYLKVDKRKIIGKLCNGQIFNQIDDFWINLSDEHFQGKTAAKIQLDNGYVIYHKPHSLSLALYYYRIQKWLFEKCGFDSFDYRIYDKEDYGWEQEVAVLSCNSQREVEVYYTRIGMQICLTYVLGITDLHFENIISHGEYPVIIDMEFIFDRRLSGYVHPDSIQDLLKDTVANTGLLPTALGDDLGLNVGGLGETAVQTVSYKMPVVIKAGTSDMAISYHEPKVNSDRSLPEWNGKKIDYREYIPFIFDGFTKAYQMILYNKKEFVKKFADGFEQKSRLLIRSTQEYFMYQNIMNFPALLKNREERRLMLFHMDKGLNCNERYRKDILNYEMDSVSHHIIPVFYAYRKNLYMGNGHCLQDYFSYSGKDQILYRIEKLSKKDYGLQKKVMETIFLSRWKQRYKAVGDKKCKMREEADVFNIKSLRTKNEGINISGNREVFTLTELSPEKIAVLFGVTLPEGCNTESYGTDGMMKRLTAKIRETKKADMCLCHGNLGLLEILNDCLNGAGIRYNGCPERMNITYNDFRDWDSECDGLSLEDRNNPGFMVGLSGVGYALLRERERKLPGVFVFGFTEAQTQIVKNMIARGGCRMKSNHAS